MARIAGVDLPRDKRVEISLTYIYGIGRSTSQQILAAANVDRDTRVRDLAETEVARLREVIDRNYRVEGDLRREIAMNIKRLQEIGCYRGIPPTGKTCRCTGSVPGPTPGRNEVPERPSLASAVRGRRSSMRIAI